MLTDGAVSDTNGVVQLIKENCDIGNSKVFSFGIGNGASRDLVIKAAEKGMGEHYFVTDENMDSLKSKVIDAL